MAIKLELTGEALRVRLTGRHALYSLKRSLTVPLDRIADARAVDRDAISKTKTLRAPGTSLPGRIKAGTFRGGAGKEFWDVRHAVRVLELELRDADYTRVVLEVADPDAEADRIRAALAALAGNGRAPERA
jgi:hypothetical protein